MIVQSTTPSPAARRLGFMKFLRQKFSKGSNASASTRNIVGSSLTLPICNETSLRFKDRY